MIPKFLPAAFSFILASFVLTGCGNIETEAKYPNHSREDSVDQGDLYGERETIFGEGGLSAAFGNKDDQAAASPIGVNKYLWRASLDTISFMPLATVDPFGGVIITDWYAAPDVPDQRNKVNVFITDTELRAGALKVTLFREEKRGSSWQSVAVTAEDQRKVEDAILTKARELRVKG